MWKLTLKERRRHGELMARLQTMKANPYLRPPEDYEPGKDPEEDDKYREAQEAFLLTLKEIDELETRGRKGD